MQASPFHRHDTRFLVSAAWALTIFASLLPVVLWDKLAGSSTAWLVWARLAVLGALIPAVVWIKRLRPLRDFIIVLFIMYAAPELTRQVDFSLPFLQDLLGGSPFARSMWLSFSSLLSAA